MYRNGRANPRGATHRPAVLPARSFATRVRRPKPRSTPAAGTPPGPRSGHARLAHTLIAWFQESARDLPWRRTLDPYAIWVSEIMLQQTQVATVIPYWRRWMDAFPDATALASAPTDRVLKLWEGLGYYSRARNLQRAAQILNRDYSGQIPRTHDALLELPGIGPYTAGAIASIAFNLPAPILDGNVIRVLTRLHAWAGDPKGRDLQKKLWQEASQLVGAAGEAASPTKGTTAGNCSLLNQGLMELGATLCTPRAPDCPVCPWKGDCRAHRLGTPERFPESLKRAATTQRLFATALVEHRGRWLVRQRPAGAVNAGYWEFPNRELKAGEKPHETLGTWLAIPAGNFAAAGILCHAITRFRHVQHLFHVEVPHAVSFAGARWVSSAELELLALTGPHRRLARTLKAGHEMIGGGKSATIPK